jgi:hypothetical protein
MDYFEYLTAAYQSLSSEAQAAVVSSIGNLFAGFLVALIALMGVLWQLKNDREQRRIAREMELRKSVYLEAGEAITNSIGLITKYSEVDTEDTDLNKQFSVYSSIISKTNVIADVNTLNSIQKISLEIGKAVLKYSLKRAPIIDLKAKIKAQDEIIQTFTNEQNRLVEVMKSLNLEGVIDKQKWEYINNYYKFSTDQVKEARAKRGKLSEEIYTYAFDLHKECLEDTARISQTLLPEVLTNIRNELGLPLNTEAFRALIYKNYSEIKVAIDTFIVDVKTHMAQKAKDDCAKPD